MLSKTEPMWFVCTIDHYTVTFKMYCIHWLDFVDPVCIISRDQYSGINVCVLDSVLRHIGNLCCSRQWLRSATVASISAVMSYIQFSPQSLQVVTGIKLGLRVFMTACRIQP